MHDGHENAAPAKLVQLVRNATRQFINVNAATAAGYQPGTEMTRRFNAEHDYRQAGTYRVRLTLRRANERLAESTVSITVRPGLGDTSQDGQ